MNVIVYTNILLSVIISTCTAAGLTDEQLAQIFNEKSDRTDLLPDTRDDFTSIRDEVNSLDQTLSLLGETDDTLDLQNDYKDMPGNLDAYKQSSGNFDLDDNDDVSTFDENLDLAYLLQQMADEGLERQGLDMDTCLQTYGQNSLLCTEILEKSKIQERMNTVPCSTQTCRDKFASLFKRGIKRSRQNECKSVECRVSQYVKKSFCNRYGCGRRRKKTDKESQLSGISDVYPVWESTKDSLILSEHDAFPVARSNTFRENQPRDDFRRIPPLCGTSSQDCLRKKVKKVKKFRQ